MTDATFTIGPLHQVGIATRDLEQSILFYRDQLGLEFIAVIDPPGLAFFQLGESRLLLERADPPISNSGTLYFQVPDIMVAYKVLCERGVHFDQSPHLIHRDDAGTFGQAGDEEWMAFFKDPEGNSLAIASRTRASSVA